MPPLPIAWETAQVLGMCAVAGCLVLCVLSVRPRAGAAGAFPLRDHELLAWLTLTAAALHVALLLGVDHRVVEHVKPTAPWYEYAGSLALFTLFFLTLPARGAVRSRLWRRHRTFQAAHVAAACLLVVALATHVLTTDRYVHGRAQAIAYALLSGISLLALLRPRAERQSAQPQSRPSGRLVFGRYSRFVLAIVLCSLAALIVLIRPGTALMLREPVLRRNEPLLLAFPHEKHREVNCIQCHHNFADRTGSDSCISCHRSGRADIRVGAEARFHDFCLGCHRDPPARLTGRGPVTGCNTCHAPVSGTGIPSE